MALLSKPGLIQLKVENQNNLLTTQVNKINFTGSGVTSSVGQFNDITVLINGGGVASGVTQIIAGTNISISPPGGTGVVTINSSTPVSASYALSASYAATSSYSVSSSYATTASFSERTTQIDVYVKNQSGYTITKGMVVRITGSNNSSDIPRIITASYENDDNSANTLGIAREDITDGNEGFVITEGVLIGIDTNAYISGQLLYLGATGSITGSAPRSPLHAVRLGEVIRHQSNNGSIYVRIDNGYELGELHDVLDNTTTSSFGDLLIKSGSVWTNSKSLTGSYSITGSLIVSGSSTFTNIGPAIFSGSVEGISGFTGSFSGSFTGSLFGTSSWSVSSSQAISSSWAISSSRAISSSTSLTASSVDPLFQNTVSITGSSTATSLQIRTVSASVDIHGTAASQINVRRSTAIGTISVWRYNGSQGAEIGTLGGDPFNILSNNRTLATFSDTGIITLRPFNQFLLNTGSFNYIYTTSSTSNVSIGVASDLGARLGIRGTGATSATTAFLVQNSTPITLFQILNNGAITIPTGSLTVSGSLLVTGSLNATTITGSFTGSFSGSFTGSLQGTSSWAISSSQAISASFAISSSRAISSSWAPVFPYTGSANITGSLVVTGSITSTAAVYSNGDVEAKVNLRSMFQAGDEGGEIFLNVPATNTTLATGVTIDLYQDKLRIFESGGTNKGGYFNISTLAAGVGTDLKPAGFTGTVTILGNPPPNNLNFTDGILISVT